MIGVGQLCDSSIQVVEIFVKKFDVTYFVVYSSPAFDEDLHEHISHDLADDARSTSDTS